MKTAKVILLQIQRAQQHHDVLAHKDILNLDTQTRIKHMVLHFLKYAGKMIAAKEASDYKKFADAVVDTFIICLATANALNVSLGSDWDIEAEDLEHLTFKLANMKHSQNVLDTAISDLVKIAGRMAKSIESTDHLERGNPRAELEALISELAHSVLISIGRLEIKISSLLQERWKIVEEKSIFYSLDDA